MGLCMDNNAMRGNTVIQLTIIVLCAGKMSQL
jgi:hypothetical protein